MGGVGGTRSRTAEGRIEHDRGPSNGLVAAREPAIGHGDVECANGSGLVRSGAGPDSRSGRAHPDWCPVAHCAEGRGLHQRLPDEAIVDPSRRAELVTSAAVCNLRYPSQPSSDVWSGGDSGIAYDLSVPEDSYISAGLEGSPAGNYGCYTKCRQRLFRVRGR